MTRRADVRHITQDNLRGRKVDACYDVANSCTEEQLAASLIKLKQENLKAYDYIINNVGLDCFAKVRFWNKKCRLYGKPSGVMGNDSECNRMKYLGIRDCLPLDAVIRYHELLHEVIDRCIRHANFLAETNQPLCEYAQNTLDRYKLNNGCLSVLPCLDWWTGEIKHVRATIGKTMG